MMKKIGFLAALGLTLATPHLAQAAVTITSLTYYHDAIPNCEDTVSGSPCSPVGVTLAGATNNQFLNNLVTKAINLGYGSYYTFGNPYAGTFFMIPGETITAVLGLSDGTTLTASAVTPDLSTAGLSVFDFGAADISIVTTGITNADRMSFGYAPGAFTADGNRDYVLQLNYAAVPEPAAWAMMIVGMGLAGATLRKRRTALAA